MPINLRTVFKPDTLKEAAERLSQRDVYPLYGSNFYFVDPAKVQKAVDLSKVVGNQCEMRDKACWIGGCATLDTIASCDRQLAMVLDVEAPPDLRQTLTLADVLMERDPDSLLLALLLGLEAQIHCYGTRPLEMEQWFRLSPDERRKHLIEQVVFSYNPVAPVRFVIETMSLNPGEPPIVAAIGFTSRIFRYSQRAELSFVVCGLADRPQAYKPAEVLNLYSQRSDERADAKKRTELAKLVSQQAILKVVQLSSDHHDSQS